ncbi:MAG: PKD domain-containing protein, partial [Burkholderiaceae bacterium]
MTFRTTSTGLFSLALCGVLVACGGGDSNGTPAPAPAPPPPSIGASPTCTSTEAFSAVADVTVAVGKVAGAVVAGCNGAISNVLWTQTAGPTVALLSAKTQGISFEPPSAGTYSFAVTFTDASGAQRSATVSTNAVTPAAPVAVLVRVDHAARKGGNVSLRAWPALASGEANTWTQTAGPQVTLDASDPNRVLFVAPEVSRDTALTFRVTRRTAAGATDTDDVYV